MPYSILIILHTQVDKGESPPCVWLKEIKAFKRNGMIVLPNINRYIGSYYIHLTRVGDLNQPPKKSCF